MGVWSASTGVTFFNTPTTYVPTAVIGSGAAMVGYAEPYFRPFIAPTQIPDRSFWAPTFLPGTGYNLPQGVAEDGTLIVGYSAQAATQGALVWQADADAATGYDYPSTLDGSPGPEGYSCAPVAAAAALDGQMVVGGGQFCNPWYWTQSRGFVPLGVLDDGVSSYTPNYSEAWDVTADGSKIVGEVRTGPGYSPGGQTGNYTAFVWDTAHNRHPRRRLPEPEPKHEPPSVRGHVNQPGSSAGSPGLSVEFRDRLRCDSRGGGMAAHSTRAFQDVA
jgi:hypothetical protein